MAATGAGSAGTGAAGPAPKRMPLIGPGCRLAATGACSAGTGAAGPPAFLLREETAEEFDVEIVTWGRSYTALLPVDSWTDTEVLSDPRMRTLLQSLLCNVCLRHCIT